jgi:hypothetical protein
MCDCDVCNCVVLWFSLAPPRIQQVSEQAQRGLRVLKRVRSFFQKFISIQDVFSAELKKAITYEKSTRAAAIIFVDSLQLIDHRMEGRSVVQPQT